MNNVSLLCTKIFQKKRDTIQGGTLFKEIWYLEFCFILSREDTSAAAHALDKKNQMLHYQKMFTPILKSMVFHPYKQIGSIGGNTAVI